MTRSIFAFWSLAHLFSRKTPACVLRHSSIFFSFIFLSRLEFVFHEVRNHVFCFPSSFQNHDMVLASWEGNNRNWFAHLYFFNHKPWLTVSNLICIKKHIPSNKIYWGSIMWQGCTKNKTQFRCHWGTYGIIGRDICNKLCSDVI